MSTKADKADLSTLRISHEKRDGGNEQGTRRKILIAGGILAMLAGGYFAFRTNLESGTNVELATATLTSPSQADAVLTASGYVVAQQKAAVASKGAGRLVYLAVEEGDHVRRNQVIARLEDQDVAAALEKARADFELAKADLEDAERTLERQQTLFASGLSSKAELDGAMARYRRVQASIRSAEASVKAADVALENTRIRAPFDGTVLTKNADVGEVVAPFGAASNSRGAVVTMADMNSLEVEADVSESNITRVQPGQPCEIVLDAYPEKRYKGVVGKIVPTADRAKATVLTKVKFTERDNRVLPEMSAKVTFLSKEAKQIDADAPLIITVPSNAVLSRNGVDVVFLVRDNSVTEVPVKTGRHMGGRIEIREGIAQGDVVVQRPDPALATGSRVTPKQ